MASIIQLAAYAAAVEMFTYFCKGNLCSSGLIFSNSGGDMLYVAWYSYMVMIPSRERCSRQFQVLWFVWFESFLFCFVYLFAYLVGFCFLGGVVFVVVFFCFV